MKKGPIIIISLVALLFLLNPTPEDFVNYISMGEYPNVHSSQTTGRMVYIGICSIYRYRYRDANGKAYAYLYLGIFKNFIPLKKQ